MWLFRGILAAIAGGSALAALQAAQTARAADANPESASVAEVGGPISFVGTGHFKASQSYKEPTPAGGWTYIKGSYLKVECSNLKIDAIDTTGKTVASTMATVSSDGTTCSYDLRVPAGVALTIHPDPGARGAVMGTIEDESPKEELKIDQKTELKTQSKTASDASWKSPSSLKISSDSQFLKLTPSSHSTVPLSLSADP